MAIHSSFKQKVYIAGSNKQEISKASSAKSGVSGHHHKLLYLAQESV